MIDRNYTSNNKKTNAHPVYPIGIDLKNLLELSWVPRFFSGGASRIDFWAIFYGVAYFKFSRMQVSKSVFWTNPEYVTLILLLLERKKTQEIT